MILGTGARDDLEKWMHAREEENGAITRLHDALVSGERDIETLRRLSEAMEAAHHRSMSLYQMLQDRHLDK